MRAREVATTAVGIALVTVMVILVRIPVPATGGYWHTGAVAETFVAGAFGPIIGAVAAGVGAALADLIGGYASFAPLTLLAHGSTGLLVGLLGWRRGWIGMLSGWILGGFSQVAIYFLGEAFVYQYGVAGASAELPGNLAQVGLGIVGILLFWRVKRAYPEIDRITGERTFEEES